METEQTPYEESEITLIDLLVILAKRKRLIMIGSLALVLFMATMGYVVMDRIFESTATILIPQSDSSSTSALISSLAGGSAGGMISGMLGTSSPASMYATLIESRPIADAIIDRFHLLEVWKNARFLGKWRGYTREDAVEDLGDVVKAEVQGDTPVITITVDDKDPQRAADMANGFVDELIKLVQKLAVTDASQRRAYFEAETRKSFDALSKAEDDVKRFQESTGALQIDDQAKAVLDAIANLEAQIAAKEIQIKVMKTYATERNPDIKREFEELQGLKDQRKKLEEQGALGGTSVLNPVLPTSSIPSLGTDYLRKMREYKYQEALYLLLLKQYEAARLDEARETGTVQIVGKGVVPDKKAKPKPLLMTIAAGILGFILFSFVAFILEYFERLSKNPESTEKWESFKGYLRFDFKRFLRFGRKPRQAGAEGSTTTH